MKDGVGARAERWLERVRDASYLKRWLVLGVMIGVVAGLGAIAFTSAIRLCSWLLLDKVGGYVPPTSVGEGNTFGSDFARPWAVPLVVGLGGLISGLLVTRFAPEAEGHGTDSAIDAVHTNPRGMRTRASLVKIMASAVTIGSGGSAGREGPTAQISAGFASLLSRRLDLTPADARIAVTAGIGAGIGAIFRAPLGGAVLGAEILYRDDLEAEAIFPSFIASVVGFGVFAAVEGFQPIFGYLQPGHFQRLDQLPFYLVIGVTAGVFGRVYAGTFYGSVGAFHRVSLPAWLKPALAGVAVGLIGLAIPGVLGTGYGWLQRAMTPRGLDSIAVWIVLALPLAKVVATSLTIGSGGSGGIFGPGMVIGGFVGASIWLVAEHLGGAPLSPTPFVVVGMTACFGSIAHAPIAMILMVAEMTGTLELILPAMVAIGLATLVVGDRTIYEHQRKDRKDSPPRRVRATMPLLASIPVTAGMDPGGPARDADPTAPTVPASATLEDAVESLAAMDALLVPVLDDEHRVVGVVTAASAMRAYRTALRVDLPTIDRLPPDAGLVEAVVVAGSPVSGRPIHDALFGGVVVAVRRGDRALAAVDEVVLSPGDDVIAVIPVARRDEFHAMFRRS